MANLQKINPNTSSDKPRAPAEIHEFLKSRIINQDRAITRVVREWTIAQSPFKSNNRPICSLLCLGPSGVGKTSIAKALAEFFYGNRKALTKVDCSTLKQSHDTSKLIGSPPGYLGYGESPWLAQERIDHYAFEYLRDRDPAINNFDQQINTIQAELKKAKEKKDKEKDESKITSLSEALLNMINKRNEYFKEKSKYYPSIILFDEMGSNHPALEEVLLHIIDEASLRMSNGQTTNFSNSFIIMTSNIGSRLAARILEGKIPGFMRPGQASIGLTSRSEDRNRSIYKLVTEEAKTHFRPEFLGRLQDDIVAFNFLSTKDLKNILDIKLNELQRQVESILVLHHKEEVKQFILKEANDHPEYGARLIEKKVDKYLREPLANLFVHGAIEKHDRVISYVENGEIKFKYQRLPKLLDPEKDPIEI